MGVLCHRGNVVVFETFFVPERIIGPLREETMDMVRFHRRNESAELSAG